MTDWTVKVFDDATLFVRDAVLVAIYRRRGDYVDVVLRDGSVSTIPALEEAPRPDFPELPRSSLEGLRDALDRYLGRRPGDRVEDVLREWVEVERERVDDVIGRLFLMAGGRHE